MPTESELHEKAVHCRRLAAATVDDRTKRALTDLAREYDAKAKVERARNGHA